VMGQPAVDSDLPRSDARRLLAELLAREGGGGARIAPASPAQQRHWFHEQLVPGSDAYNVAFALRLAGPVDPPALERALEALCARHESLRTVFNTIGGEVAQIVRPPGRFTVPREDLSAEPDIEAAARARCTEEAGRPFSLTEGPLLRALLLRLGEDDHVLALTVHHVVVDGRSLAVLLRDLDLLYRVEIGLAAEPPAPPQTQYVDYTLWQRERLAAGLAADDLAYWRERLRGAPTALGLPLDRPRPPTRRVRGRSFWRGLPAVLRDEVARLAAAERATPFMVLLAMYAEVLGRAAAQDDVVVGTPVAGRTRVEFEDTVGCFVNTVALRIDRSRSPSFRTLLARTRETTIGGFAHQEAPFDQVVQELVPKRDPRHTPIFQVAFSYEPASIAGERLGEAAVEPFSFLTDVIKFDVELVVVGAQASWAFDQEVLDEETVTALAGRYERLLRLALAEPDRPLARLPVLTPEERRQLVRASSTTAAPLLGRPAANAAFYVVDARGELVAPGEAGEVWVGGAELADGYAGRAAATAERFRPDPFSGRPGARLHATGELGRRRRDGTIELVERPSGRIDPPDAPGARAGPVAPPRSATERALVRIWESVLGRDGISPGDSFFSVGGNSLRALQVVASIRDELGTALPVAALFTHQTIADLAAAVDAEASAPAAARSRLALLQAGTGPPVVLVHPVGGGVYCYRSLVDALLPGVPVHAFEATEPHESSLVDLAELYLAELLERGPALPAVLGGWSLGGVVAFEMARLLEERTGRAAPVVLVDSHVGPFGDEVDADEAELAGAFVYELSLGFGVDAPPLDAAASASSAIAGALAAWRKLGVADGFDLETLLARFALFRANHRALSEHRQRPYGGPVRLVAAPRTPPLVESWRPLAPRVTALALEGDHFTLLRPPAVEHVAAVVAQALAEVACAQ